MSRHSTEPGCIFCKIVAGEIPSSKVLETDEAIVFMDINPVNRGHILVVPKGHAANLADLPDDQAAHVGSLLPRLCRAVRSAANADGFNVVVNGGTVAGQTVDHCHFHVIPRFHGDPVHWPWPHTQYQADELKDYQLRIARALS